MRGADAQGSREPDLHGHAWITGEQLSAIRRAQRALKEKRNDNYQWFSNVEAETNQRNKERGQQEIDLEVARIEQVFEAVDVARGVLDAKR